MKARKPPKRRQDNLSALCVAFVTRWLEREALARRQWWLDALKPGKFPTGAGGTARKPRKP